MQAIQTMDVNHNNSEEVLCSWCGEKPVISCNVCGDVWYCSKEHKTLHWGEHFLECKSYKVEISPESGQHLVASRNMNPGTVIYKEEPIVVGPLGTSDLLCLACYAPIFENDFFKCPDCHWPMCSVNCANDIVHREECVVLSEDEKHCGPPLNQGETPRYDLIMVLRCLLLRETNFEMWNILLQMASHGMKLKEKNEPHQIAAVRYFKEICKLDIDEDVIHYIRGVILANAMEIRGPKGIRLRALYPILRIMNHSCVPNIHLSCTMEGDMEMRTAVRIAKGDDLCICYTGTDSPIWERQACLSDIHFFNCSCKRCSDPLELGTMFSSPRCLLCPQIIMKQSVENGNISWTCSKCNITSTLEDVLQENEEWTFRLEMNELFGSGSPSKIGHALAIIEQHFHIKHYLWLKAGQKALQKLQYNNEFSSVKLKKYIWEKILEIFDYLEPGLTRRRGMTIIELANAIAKMANDEFIEKGETSRQQSDGLLREASALYKEAYNIMKLEPKGSPEFAIGSSLLFQISDIHDKLNKKVKACCHA